jgi:hypothetical protein
MSELQEKDAGAPVAAGVDQPLIAIPIEDHGEERVIYFTSDAEADAYVKAHYPEGPVSFAGIWSELDADDMLQSLDRIRHESAPTPPLERI